MLPKGVAASTSVFKKFSRPLAQPNSSISSDYILHDENNHNEQHCVDHGRVIDKAFQTPKGHQITRNSVQMRDKENVVQVSQHEL